MLKKSASPKAKAVKFFRKTMTTALAERGKALPEIRPNWDGGTGTLFWNGILAKKYSQPAANQRKLLDALQIAGWPRSLPNPFTGEHGQDLQEVLHDTLKGLNKNQMNKLLAFHGDGTGNGFWWELTEEALAMLPQKKMAE
jgi:hypothetical protein